METQIKTGYDYFRTALAGIACNQTKPQYLSRTLIAILEHLAYGRSQDNVTIV
jgi:hypothetical protein